MTSKKENQSQLAEGSYLWKVLLAEVAAVGVKVVAGVGCYRGVS